MFGRGREYVPPTLDEIRKRAQILIIDDQEWPHRAQLETDHFHVTRWIDVEDTDSLTNGSFALVLLDINGVGLKHSPERQGIGILDYIKKKNPAQLVIVYSAKPQSVRDAVTLARADAVMDKGSSYLEFRDKIDSLLSRRATPDYFIASMNQALGVEAARVPKAVPLALKALRTGNSAGLNNYLAKTLSNEAIEEVVAFIIRVGIKVLTGAA
jgi:response regulator RpfG family c-di-GMP phosphodiesterase